LCWKQVKLGFILPQLIRTLSTAATCSTGGGIFYGGGDAFPYPNVVNGSGITTLGFLVAGHVQGRSPTKPRQSEEKALHNNKKAHLAPRACLSGSQRGSQLVSGFPAAAETSVILADVL